MSDRADELACAVCHRESCEDASHVPPLAAPRLRAFSLPDLLVHRFPPRRGLLYRGDTAILRAGHLAQIHAERGIGKTWFCETLALVAATGVDALGFSALEPCRVLYVDGEMASEEVQDRFQRLVNVLDVPAPERGRLTLIGADWQDDYLPQLDTPQGQAAIEPFVDPHDLIYLDNRSCLFDPEGEKDPTAWQPAQTWLLELRRRGKAVVMLHHANRQGGARGHSKAEDILNLGMQLSRPDGYTTDQGARFVVDWTKTRGIYGGNVASFIVGLTPTGWTLESTEANETQTAIEKLRAHLRLCDQAGERPKTSKQAIRDSHIRYQDGLKAWSSLRDAGELAKHPDGGWCLQEIAR